MIVTPALEIISLRKIYKNGVTALNGIDLRVEDGDFFALLGPNGAGKSTVIGIISSLVNKTSGTVRIKGIDIQKDFQKAKSFLGVVPQEFNFNVFETPWQILVNQAGYYGIPRKVAETRVEKYLSQMGLWSKRDDRARELSGGMKRRLIIARSLVHEPRLLILDEPTAGLDMVAQSNIIKLLNDLRRTHDLSYLIVSHDLAVIAELCEWVGVMKTGKLTDTLLSKHLVTRRQNLAPYTRKLVDAASNYVTTNLGT